MVVHSHVVENENVFVFIYRSNFQIYETAFKMGFIWTLPGLFTANPVKSTLFQQHEVGYPLLKKFQK